MPSCHFCAEEIDKGTLKCPHCGESLETERLSVGLARWRGDALLVTADGGHVPARGCVLCGSSEATARERKFTYTPPWVYLGLLGGLLPLLILAVVGQKKARVWVPLCAGCLGRWRLGEAGVYAFALLGFVLVPALFGFATRAVVGKEDAMFVGVAVGLVAWIGGVVALKLYVSRRLQVRCTLVEEGEASLAFPDVGQVRGLLDLPRL